MAIDGVPKELALELAQAAGIVDFVETGTYKGDTTRWAAENFERVITIEAYKPRYTKTKSALKALKNITLVNDDSRNLYKHMPEGAAVLWLDAHWCGDYEKSLGTPGECPLIDELYAVRESDIILIDDARLFTSPPPRPHDPAQWPDLASVRLALPGRYIAIYNDVIIAVPQKHAPIVRKHTKKYDALHTVCLTSNKYIGLVPGFCYLYLKTIGEGVPCTVVRYDEKPAKQAPVFAQFAIGMQSDYTWSEGLLRYLDYYNDDLILLMLEDYWMTGADIAGLRAAWKWMQEHGEIDKLDLSGDRMKFAHEATSEKIGDYELVKASKDAQFLTSLQAAIWRVDFLRSALEPTENPWQFEKKGSKRVAGKCVVMGTNPPMLQYVNACGGEGNKPGEVDHKKVPASMFNELQGRRII